MKNSATQRKVNRIRRHARVRAKVSGTAKRPRIAVFKGHRHVYAQAIDDVAGTTLAAVNDAEFKTDSIGQGRDGSGVARATATGKKLAELLMRMGITTAVFDASGFRYHGRIRAVADGLRESGIIV